MKHEGLDQRIIHAFTMGYWNLHKKQIISAEKLDKVLDLIDKLEDHPPPEIKKRLAEIFKEHPI